jgi:ankyrin repeat protein
MRVVDDGAPGPDSYRICNSCGRRWFLSTIGGYPQDTETVRVEVTDEADVEGHFVMDATTDLSLAAQRGDCEAARRILDSGASIDLRSHIWELPATPSRLQPLVAGGTAPMAAVYFAREECVELLLERGADPNAKSVDRQTPLNIAVRLGSTEP